VYREEEEKEEKYRAVLSWVYREEEEKEKYGQC
jgi:hypothetical protein